MVASATGVDTVVSGEVEFLRAYIARVEDALDRAEDSLLRVQEYFDDHHELHVDDDEIEELYLSLSATLLELRGLTEADA